MTLANSFRWRFPGPDVTIANRALPGAVIDGSRSPRSGNIAIIPQASPEFALVCACIARPLSPARISACGSADTDWQCVTAIAKRHRIEGLVREGLSAAGLPVPPAIAQSAHQIMHTGLRQAAEALRIQQQLEKAGVPALFLKGSTLAVRAYGSIAVRSSMDIDMVVAPGDVPCAWQVLEEAGYVMTAPARALPAGVLRTYQTISKDSVHRNPANGVKIELHWRLSDAAHESALPPPREWRQVEINPTLTLSTLSDPALFAYLSAHGAGHGWARLKWLADIGALLGNSEDGGSALWESARSSGAARPAASAIMLANTLLGTPLPPGFVPPRSVRLRLLNALSLRVIAAGGGARELSHTRWNSVVEPAAMLLTLSNWPDAWAQIRRIAIPAEDIVLLRLPPGFGFLYPLLRLPLWILKRTRWSPRVHVKLPQRAA